MAIQKRRHQVHWFNHRRMHGFYALAPRLVRGDQACGFGEMVLIDGETRTLKHLTVFLVTASFSI